MIYDYNTIFFTFLYLDLSKKRKMQLQLFRGCWLCSLLSVFVQTDILWILRFAVTFAAVVLCCLDTIILIVRQSLSFTFSFHQLFFFADEVLSCFVHIVKIVKIVLKKKKKQLACYGYRYSC